MSEESNTMVDFKHEDQFSYLTDEGDLILKQNSLFDERKVAEVSGEDELAETIHKLKEAFDSLEKKVDKATEKDKNEEWIDGMIDELKEARAIGDYDALYNRLKGEKQQLKSRKGYSGS
ncbi:MAG: hypothetical protein U5K69_10310 [Balneolaceae bacterium]|nr:hypothetical protein [Balneolaceae bacterium]